MDVKELYRSKKVDVFAALDKIQSNSVVWTSYNSMEPSLFLSQLHTIAPRVENVLVRHAGVIRNYPFVPDPAMKGRIVPVTGFTDDYTRSVHDLKLARFVPSHLHNGFGRSGRADKLDVLVCMASPMDDNGCFRLSLSVTSEMEALAAAKMVILEVNPHLPITNGDNAVHISDVDFLYESSDPLITLPDAEPGEIDMKIGGYVAGLVPDGATIQLGIGNIPNAVAKFFMEKNDLGVHTEMITSSMAHLAKAGVINGKKKTLHRGKMIGNFALGSQELYDYMHENPSVWLMPGRYTNDPFVIAQNNDMISINAALQIDMVGQICSESIGTMQYSGSGGALDFAMGANHSKGGKSIIAVRSTVKRGTMSTIQPILTPGSIVTIGRNDIDYIVTEYGIARMKGASIAERVHALIEIAHPDFRDELRDGAERYKLW